MVESSLSSGPVQEVELLLANDLQRRIRPIYGIRSKKAADKTRYVS